MTNNTDNKARLSKIISDSIKSSPFAASTHEKHYVQKRDFKYGVGNLNELIACIDINENKDPLPRLVLDMSNTNIQLKSAAQHEYAHIDWMMRAEKLGVKTSYASTLEEELTLRLLDEAHAHTVQVEGPLRGYFKQLNEGHLANANFYRHHFADGTIAPYAKAYIGGLFQKNFETQNSIEIADLAGYHYMNGFSKLEKTERSNRIIQARKATVGKFFYQKDLKNNNRLDYYIGATGNYYIKNYEQKLQRKELLGEMFKTMNLDINTAPILKAPKTVPLETVLGLANTDDQLFLPNNEWYDVLKAKSNTELVSRLVIASDHRDFILDVKNKTQNLQKKYSY